MAGREKTLVAIVDDDPTILAVFEETLGNDSSLAIQTFGDSRTAYAALESRHFDLLITDLMMPEVDGLTLLEHALRCQPGLLVVIITGYASLETTLEAIRAGVYDYITKPFRLEEFRLVVKNASERVYLTREVARLDKEGREASERLAHLDAQCRYQQEELQRLQEELGRRQDLMLQTGGGSNSDTGSLKRLDSYRRILETTEERYERQARHLEDLYSSGCLTSSEFELAVQNLRTMV